MNIYVSRLSYSTQSESLQNLFSQFGEVSSANIIMDRMTGRSRGFCFVEMPNEEEAQKAIDILAGYGDKATVIGRVTDKPGVDIHLL